eukprot:scaffold12605_cov93-Skeletonema_marinoi.AAC.4
MEHRYYNYYEAHEATIDLGDITSSAKNANTLLRLRDGDDKLCHLSLGRGIWDDFNVDEDDDMGWLGYFIGKSEYLQRLAIKYLPDGEEGHAFAEGIAHNQSLRNIDINNLSNYGFTSVMRALRSLSQLEGLTIWPHENVDPDGWSELGTLLESGVCKLEHLHLSGNTYIGNAGMGVLSNGLRNVGSSLIGLTLYHNSIGNEGLSTFVEALQTCTSLETLAISNNDFSSGMGVLSNGLRAIGSSLNALALNANFIGNEGLSTLVEALANCTGLQILSLSYNNFSSATAGLGSLSDWLQSDEVNLNELDVQYCGINDGGLHALEGGAAIQCRELNLQRNESITTLGLSYLSNSIRSNSCRVEFLGLKGIPIGDDAMEVLAQGLVGNQSLISMDFGDDISVTSAGSFSRALCDTSSVNNTYLSNHTICEVFPEDVTQDISRYLQLHDKHPQYAARCKILMKHRHLDMTPLFHWGLKFLPLAVAWFERAKPCTSLTIEDYDSSLRRRVLEESDEAFESRELTAMYEFIRGMPMKVMKSRSGLAVAAAYDKKISRIEEENKIALERRDRKIEQLEEEIMRLRGL